MDNIDIGMDRLFDIYTKLDDSDKIKIIRLGEGLLNSQKVIDKEKIILTEKKDDTELKKV